MFKESVIINDEVVKGIEECIDLAPLHNPNSLRGIRALREILGQATPQVAVFFGASGKYIGTSPGSQ